MILGRTLVVICVCAIVFAACSGGGGGREVEIVASDSGCLPASVQARAGEKLMFKVVNQANGDRELEGIEGTRLEEVLVPAGRTRQIEFTVPKAAGIAKLKCYIPGGPSTIIEVQVSATIGADGAESVNATVEVNLEEWSVKPSVAEVSAGRVRFSVHNRGGVVHELAVLSVGADGQKREVADFEGIQPGQTATFVTDLKPGRYELACLIVPGEQGSSFDHYQKGMHTSFIVR